LTCKAENCDKTLASAVTDMLATSLFQTGRFILLERGIGLQAVEKEIDLSQTGYVNLLFRDQSPRRIPVSLTL